MAENSAAAAAGNNADYMKIKVIGLDGEVNFRIKLGTSMAWVTNAYACHVGVSVESLHFLFYGRPIYDKDTPKSLEMENDDVIKVFRLQPSGYVRISG
ncbi:hypothetical protein B9Z55_027855 [Caenorhabditis nigoni]|uniref:Ubiquitin-like domain-containing protein n=1 Tax=Caenorhabditis nigoni TaxID=1611254 RepID=A0A2G5SDV1_9PELO|nr:hypothetical protein B9Z55_027855 [Caenorhabditis nigoni]